MTEAPRLSSRGRPTLGLLAVIALVITGACTDPTAPTGSSDVPVDFGLSPSPVGTMTSADEHACALRESGVIECFGDDTDGEAPAVVEAAGVRWFTHLDVSDQHSCAVRNDGWIECWGLNTFGKAPEFVAGDFVRVATGVDHSCAVRSDGVIECWGDDGSHVPSIWEADTAAFVDVSAGFIHTCGLRTDGVIECVGFGIPPVRASANGSPYVSMSSNVNFTCAVRSDGVAECFGELFAGGEYIDSVQPSGSSFVQVSAGLTHACALRADGVIQCWGDNDQGEAPSEWTAPTGVFVHVSAGNHFTCAARDNGFVSCVGAQQAPDPGKPASLVATHAGGVVTLAWPDVTNETTYEVTRREANGDGSFTVWGRRTVLGPGATAYADSTVIPGTGYEYRVRACASGGCSPFVRSNIVYVPEAAPLIPVSVRAIAAPGGGVDVTWVDSTGTETHFDIDRRLLNDSTGVWGSWARVNQAIGSAATWHDSTAAHGLRYRYRVRACNTVGCSTFRLAPVVLVETRGTAPSEVNATALSAAQVQLSWPASSNATSYTIQRRIFVDGVAGPWQTPTTVAASAPAESWIDSTVTANTLYRYRVRGCTVVGCSAYTLAPRVRTPAS